MREGEKMFCEKVLPGKSFRERSKVARLGPEMLRVEIYLKANLKFSLTCERVSKRVCSHLNRYVIRWLLRWKKKNLVEFR